MLLTSSAKGRDNKTRAVTYATPAAGGDSARSWPSGAHVGGHSHPLLTAYLLRLQVVYSSSSSIEMYDVLYAGYGALI